MLIGSVIGTSGEARAQDMSECPALIVETFGETAWAACRVAWCESTWRSWAISPDGQNYGWFQVNLIHGLGASALDPEVNVAFAYRLSRGGTDWSHWSCKP